MPKPRITYFFRKPTASFHSIEQLFDTVIMHLRRSTAEKITLPYRLGENTLALLKNCYFARRKQGQINHITGEIYYIAPALKKQNTILTIHDIESLGSLNKIKKLLLQFFWLHLPVKSVKYVTVVSEYSKKKLLYATGIAASKVVVIPNCVPFSAAEFKPKYQINKGEAVLLQVGTKSNKNLENLAKALNGLPCRLIIIGKLSDGQIELLAANKISYEHYQSLAYDEVRELYYKADLVTFVSTFEGFGMPILEANALGRPVITSITASMPEVAGDAALLVDPFSPSEIRLAIEKLISDDQLRNDLVAAGFNNVKRFSPEAVAAQYENLYERVLNEK